MVSAQIALEKLRQRDQLFKTENEMLKVEKFVFIIFYYYFFGGRGDGPCTKWYYFFFFFIFHQVFGHTFICVDGECKS